jgi:hypothetical protein
MEKEQEAAKKIKFLSDNKTKQDSFTHSRVAKAISNIILNDDVGKSIALKGNWGSGKSSIVDMVEEELLKGQHIVFVYDSWVHEGDPLRRSFLESFIQFCIEKDLINVNINFGENGKNAVEYWEEQLEFLSKRKEEFVITKKSFPTWDAIGFTVCSLIALFFSSFLRNWPNLSWPIFILSIIGTFLPILYIVFRIINYNNINDFFRTGKILIPPLLKDNNDETVTSKAIKTPDPTSIEFQKIFIDLLNCIVKCNLSENCKFDKKILVVIDNLDRVDSDDALTIWTTMKGFFEIDNKYKWKDKLWLLVPFDFEAIKKLWRKNDKSKLVVDSITDDILDIKYNNNELNVNCASSFTEKTFQLQFDTPMPYQSKWHDFFNDKFNEIFQNNYDKKQRLEIYKIYKTFLDSYNNSLPPTPREIKLFINNLFAMYLTYNESRKPLYAIALFVLLKKYVWKEDSVKIISDLMNKSTISDNYLINQYYKRNIDLIASFYFNSDEKDARQLRLGPTLLEVIKNCDLEKMISLREVTGFYEVILDVIQDNIILYNRGEAYIIGYMSRILNSINNKEKIEIISSWQTIKDSVKRIEYFNKLDDNSALGFCELIRVNNNEEELTRTLVSKIYEKNTLFVNFAFDSNLNEKKVNGTIDELLLDSILSGLKILFEYIDKNIKQIKIADTFKVNIPNLNYLELIELISSKYKYESIFKYFKPEIDSMYIINDLNQKIKQEKIPFEKVSNIFRFLSLVLPNGYYDEILEYFKTAFLNHGENRTKIMYYLMSALHLQRVNAKSKTVLSEISSNGAIFHQLYSSLQEANYNEVSILLFVIIVYNDKLNMTANVANATSGLRDINMIIGDPQKYEKIIDLVYPCFVNFELLNRLFELSQNPTYYELCKIFFKKLKNANIEERLNCEDIINNEKFIYESLLEEYGDFIIHFNKKQDLINCLIRKVFDKSLSRLYLSILKNIKNDEFVKYIKNGLSDIDKETWAESSKDLNINIFDLLIELINNKNSEFLQTEYFDFLTNGMDNLLNNNLEFIRLNSNFDILLKGLMVGKRKIFMENTFDAFNNSTNTIQDFIKIFNSKIIDCNILNQKLDSLYKKSFYNIIGNKDIEQIQWLIEIIALCPNVINNTGYAFDNFKDKLIAEWSDKNTPDGVNELLKKLAIILNINLPDKNSGNDTIDNEGK